MNKISAIRYALRHPDGERYWSHTSNGVDFGPLEKFNPALDEAYLYTTEKEAELHREMRPSLLREFRVVKVRISMEVIK